MFENHYFLLLLALTAYFIRSIYVNKYINNIINNINTD